MYWNMWNIQGCYRGYASSAGGRRRLQEIEGFLCSKHIEEEGSKSYKIFAKFTHVFCYLCFSSAPYHVASKLRLSCAGFSKIMVLALVFSEGKCDMT